MKKTAVGSEGSDKLTGAAAAQQRFLEQEKLREQKTQAAHSVTAGKAITPVKPKNPKKKRGKGGENGKKAKAQTTSVSTPATSRRATIVAVCVLLFIFGYMFFSFTRSPEGQQFVENTILAEQVAVTDQGNGDFECPAGITKLEFDSRGVLQPPYPTLAEQPQRFCFNVSLFNRFLSLTGALEDTGEEITGLVWLAKTIAYPDWGNLLNEVTTALTNVTLATNMQTVGWIELPGTAGRQSQPGSVPNPGSNPGWNTSVPMPVPNADATPMPTAAPTSTPVPTVAFAEIPLPEVVSTPENPAVAAIYPEGVSYTDDNPETTNSKVLMYQAMCKAFYPNVNIAELQYSGIWSVANVLEFNNDEYGTSALGPVDGNSAPREFCQDDGNCFQIYVREACILQVTGFNWGGSIDYGGGYKASPSWSQVRQVPLYGPGDGKTNTGGQNSVGNTQECYWHGLWFFACEVVRPQQAEPTATPMPYPTSTPFAGYGSLSDYVNYEWLDPNNVYDDGMFGVNRSPKYWASSCPGVNGTTVRMLYGGTCTHEGASHMVNLQDVWGVLDHSYGEYFVVRCDNPMTPEDRPNAELGSTGVCFGPVK